MNLTRLQTFVAVVRSGTFAGAADELAFTPSAVSQQMSKLEAELGTALLVRDGRGVAGHRGRIELTDAGRRLHERALAIAAAVREAQAELDALRSGRPDRLRLGSFPAATGGVVPRALCLLRRRLPSTQVELREDDPVAGVRDGRLDLALTAGLDLALTCDDPAVAAVVLARTPLSVAMPSGHPLAAREAVEPGALDGALLVGAAGVPEVAAVLAACASVGVRPQLTGWRVPDPRAQVLLAAAGEGLAVVPALLAGTPPPRTVLRPLAGGPAWELRGLRPAHGSPSVPALAMLEALRAVVTVHAVRQVAVVAAAA